MCKIEYTKRELSLETQGAVSIRTSPNHLVTVPAKAVMSSASGVLFGTPKPANHTSLEGNTYNWHRRYVLAAVSTQKVCD